MAWVVDPPVLAARDAATNQLKWVVEVSSLALARSRAVEHGTRMAIGYGHAGPEGIIQSAMQAIDCLHRAQSAASAAISELGRVNIVSWEPDRG